MENSSIVQTDKSIVTIEDARLVELLEYIEEENIDSLDEKVVEVFFNREDGIVDDVIRFLYDNKIIYKSIKKELLFNRIVLISNNQKFSDLFSRVFCEKYEVCVINNDEYNTFDYCDKDLCIVFSNPFNLKEYNKINSFIASKNLVVKNILFYNHCIYISNFYKKDWFNPCYKCFVSNLEAQLRGTLQTDKMNFQLLVDMIYQKQGSFDIYANLSSDKYILVIYTLINQLEKITNKDTDINKIYEIDYNRMRINEDVVYYWEVCDCYE